MQLVDGAHHITFLTEDMDRLIDFYRRVFDAEHEVMLERPGGIDPEKLKRENWTTVEL